MTNFGRTNLAAALVACAVLYAGPEPRWPALLAVFFVWNGIVAYGTVRLDSGFFCRAVCRVPDVAEPVVALTFDDGPDAVVTPRLLDLLAERQVEAAFFCVGDRVARAPEVARRAVLEGHLVENHSSGHRWWTNFLFTRAMTNEIASCSQVIEAATGVAPRYYRPPFGFSNHATAEAARRAGLEVVGWQVRGFDGAAAPSEGVVARVLDGVSPGAIILLHDGHRDPERVMANVVGVLDGLAARGLRVERLDRVMASPAAVPLSEPRVARTA